MQLFSFATPFCYFIPKETGSSRAELFLAGNLAGDFLAGNLTGDFFEGDFLAGDLGLQVREGRSVTTLVWLLVVERWFGYL